MVDVSVRNRKPLFGVYTATILDVEDPDATGRVKVGLELGRRAGEVTETWARWAAPASGDQRGFWARPEIGHEVVVAFEAGDIEKPFVLGALWNGENMPPSNDEQETILRTRSGAEIVFDDTNGSESVTVELPSGPRVRLRQEGESVEIRDGHGNRIELGPGGVTIVSSSQVTVSGAVVDVSAGQIRLSSSHVRASGVLQCDTLVTNTVVSAVYTPGAGNIW